MNTTPLPPLPENTPHLTRRIRACESEVPAQVVLEHAMQAYATAARADLEAENARMADALLNIQMLIGVYTIEDAAEMARAALENRS